MDLLRQGWLLLVAALLLPAIAVAWPTVPLPAGSQGEKISESMNYNGLEMRASRFETTEKLDAVVEFYGQHWGEDRHVVTPFGEKTIVGHATPGYYITVELSPQGARTAGVIGIVKAPKDMTRPELGKGFYRPAGTEVLSDVVHNDTPGNTRTIVLRNRLSPYANLQLYGGRLGQDGWRGVPMGKCLPGSSECLIHYERAGGGRLVIALSRDDTQETSIVVNMEQAGGNG